MKQYHLALALLTLATGVLWEASDFNGEYQLLDGELSVRTDLADLLFPDSTTAPLDSFKVPNYFLTFFRYAFGLLAREDRSPTHFLPALFAYYGAVIAQKKTPSLATVGYTASLGLLASPLQEKCPGRLQCSDCGDVGFQHNLVGDRAAIEELISSVARTAFSVELKENRDFRNWVKKIYGQHRSEFVHSARHHFDEFSQVFSEASSRTTIVPTAVPVSDRLVRKENELQAQIQKLPAVVRIILIGNLTEGRQTARVLNKLKLSLPDFSEKLFQEAFVGMPASGWVRAN